MKRIRNGVELVETIDLLLKEKNLTRRGFCETINIPASTIATWKTRNIFPTIDVLSLIANNLNVSLDWLVYKSDETGDNEIESHTISLSVFINNLKILLNKYNISMKRFLEENNLCLSSFVNWEKQKSLPAADVVLKIAKYFGVSVEWLLTGTNDISISKVSPYVNNSLNSVIKDLDTIKDKIQTIIKN